MTFVPFKYHSFRFWVWLRSMFRILPGFLLVVCILFTPQATRAEDNHPQRIISTSPSITEILFALGLEGRVVGVTDYCVYPEQACLLPRIGGLINPNVEVWIQLRPDLIIFQTGSDKIETNASNLKIPSLAVNMKDLDSIFASIHQLGKFLGVETASEKLIQRLETGLAHYLKKLDKVTPKSVLLLLSDTNAPGRDLYAVAQKTFLGQLLKLAGGANIIQDTLADYPKISKEYIIHTSPEVIIEAGPRSNLSEEQRQRKIEGWKKFPTIKAVQTESIHFIGANYILIPGPRMLNIVDQFAKAIHPEIFANSTQISGDER